MKPALAALALLLAVSPAAAQEAGAEGQNAWTWVERDGVVMASVAYASGPALAVRCLPGNAFQVLLAGLPAAEPDAFTRTLEVTQPNGELAESSWVVAQDRSVAFALSPSRTARSFRSGPRFTVRAPTTAGRHTRLELDLPSETAALDRVLQACNRPLEDEADLEVLPAGSAGTIDWAQRPRPNYPRAAEAARVTEGATVLDCGVLVTGRLEGCRIEAEFPYGMGFGGEALQASWTARLTTDSAQNTKGRARFTIRFRLQ
ncbi:hypothetical protein ASG17_00240 [Brevundimonas sp. Leaf363]|uniref:hypothetical protein n=1 Tax=Brevundimonas sp. Leaf363 TaxID=1736353 RepID=UPI00070045D2|nr:hypothetical protein [Brevundimonas sp. Leaf363]KQS57209.1 hypothetical protein ASG17_00240 [Brevundimonas sp. Leaf363]